MGPLVDAAPGKRGPLTTRRLSAELGPVKYLKGKVKLCKLKSLILYAQKFVVLVFSNFLKYMSFDFKSLK